LGYLRKKAARKMLLKLTPGLIEVLYPLFRLNQNSAKQSIGNTSLKNDSFIFSRLINVLFINYLNHDYFSSFDYSTLNYFLSTIFNTF